MRREEKMKRKRREKNSSTNNEENKSSLKRYKKRNTIIITIIILLTVIILVIYFVISKEKSSSNEKIEIKNNNQYLMYRLSGNSLENFDLRFLQLENEKENKIYSPLSIKYALEILKDATNSESKEQISNIMGNYNSKKYINSENMSFANALFIKDSYKNEIKDSYINTLSNKYDAEVIYDSFATPNVLNSWVSNKTFKLIDNISDNISNQKFILVNSLAINMEWINKIQSEHKDYIVDYAHEHFYKYISSLDSSDYHSLEFKDISHKVKTAEIGAVINKYDIVNTLGENKIREEVGKEYKKWLADGAPDSCYGLTTELDVNSYLDKYMGEIKTNYNDISSSTDFLFYVDDSVKVFAKDLREYNDISLQYIGIMPKKNSLSNYIKNINASSINTLINELKPIELSSFNDGIITEISGYIPMFKFDYELNLINDLNKLGITSVFESDKADLSNLTQKNIFIDRASHKVNIEFSNDGIKAAAATAFSGRGAGDCGFNYLYDVPVEQIDLTFDNPFLFLIRDKNSGEVWFTGTVYEPLEYHGFH